MHIYIIVIHVHVNAHISILLYIIILLTKTTAAQNEVALGYHRLRGLYFPAVVSVTTICSKIESKFKTKNLYTIHCVQLSQSILVLLFITPSMSASYSLRVCASSHSPNLHTHTLNLLNLLVLSLTPYLSNFCHYQLAIYM